MVAVLVAVLPAHFALALLALFIAAILDRFRSDSNRKESMPDAGFSADGAGVALVLAMRKIESIISSANTSSKVILVSSRVSVRRSK